MDRRKTYMDIVERVLGDGLLSQSRQHGRFVRFNVAPSEFGTAVPSVDERVLDSIEQKA